ncbi:hypothetical protein TNCT_183451 [Trichonephila clavata]|uniref:Endonuclease/exonuclease/phosphatase domain-containing protein n=1 Tax=Trichonephila clavata TaxID=2740835 RepID=A0A8X6HD87_TRICU|nr:hypothetical protein TNCT_183451 [Trichonephila clavata]
MQETHIQPCHHLSFPNYNIYRTDRTFRGGGTAIMIKRTIPHHEIKINNPSFETSAIKIERPNNKTITVISAYRPPRKRLLPQDLPQLFRNQDYVLVAGDLNTKHASWSPYAQQNVAVHTIRRFCDSTGFSLSAPLEPTHFHKSLRNTVIDLAISKGMTITEVSSIPELSSDHNPVLFEFDPRRFQCISHEVWGSKNSNAPGKKIFDWILENDLMLLNDKSPTYLHSSGIFTSIDLSLSSMHLNYELSWSTNTDNFGNDHLPIFIKYKGSYRSAINSLRQETNWNKFTNLLQQKLSSNENINMDIIEKIKKAQISSQHLKSKRINSRAPWWTAACGYLRAKKRQLLKKATKKHHFKDEDWIKCKEISTKLKRIIKASKEGYGTRHAKKSPLPKIFLK